MGLAIGIDLGTTNSVAGIATTEGVKLCTDQEGATVHSSLVAFPDSTSTIVGNKARIQKATNPGHTIYSAKRLIGQNIRSPMVQLAAAALAYSVEEGNNQQAIVVGGGRRMTIPEVSGMVLAYLKRLCEDQFGDEVTGAVITVPANFSDAQRQATKEAGRLAGLNVLRLINEPTAAALAYGYGKQLNQRVAVFDFGGGTFDVSVLKIENDIFEVLATDGEFFLGGDDIDRILAEFLAAEMNRSQNIDPRPVPTAMNRLNLAAAQIKHYLTTNNEASGSIDGILIDEGRSVAVDFQLDRSEFDSMIGGYVDRTIDVCGNVLASAGLGPADINEVILVGGSTRIPLVRERIAEYFNRDPVTRINPDEVVAHGAAVQAAMLGGTLLEDTPAESTAILAQDAAPIDLGFGEDAAQSTALLLDVTPAELRIATAGGYTESFLEKNSPIPIERTRVFTTAQPNQTQVVIQCCRGGESRFEDNELLGTLILNDIPEAPRGEAQIEVTFRIDPDCILHVRAKDKTSGLKVEAKLNVIGAPAVERADTEVDPVHLPAMATVAEPAEEEVKPKKSFFKRGKK